MLNSFQLITLDFWEDPYNKVSQNVIYEIVITKLQLHALNYLSQ